MKRLIFLLLVVFLAGNAGICRASDVEIAIPQLGETPFETVIGTISLTHGWNLVAMPVIPCEHYTVRQLMQDVGGFFPLDLSADGDGRGEIVFSEWSILVVAVYKDGRFKRLPPEGYSYNMVPGEAYFVYADYSGPWIDDDPDWRPYTYVEVKGRAINGPYSVSLELNRGWNGISLMYTTFEDLTMLKPTELPFMKPPLDLENIGDFEPPADAEFETKSYSLNELSDELVEQGIDAPWLAMWSREDQDWELVKLPLEGAGLRRFFLDQFVRADEGFFLLCVTNGHYVPALDFGTDPALPFPPEMPREVTYEGEVIFVNPNGELPYDFILITPDAEEVLLIPVDDLCRQQLLDAVECGLHCVVTGVIKSIECPIPGGITMLDVLMVHQVELVFTFDSR